MFQHIKQILFIFKTKLHLKKLRKRKKRQEKHYKMFMDCYKVEQDAFKLAEKSANLLKIIQKEIDEATKG